MCACEQKELAFPAGAGECEEWPISPLKSVYHELAHLLDHLPVARTLLGAAAEGSMARYGAMDRLQSPSPCCATPVSGGALREYLRACTQYAMCVCARVRACAVV